MENANKDQSVRPTSAPPEPAKKWYENKKTRAIAITFFLVVIIPISIILLFYEKSNQPIATDFPSANQSQNQEWLTYKNDELGFSIDYPKDWGFGNNELGGTTSRETNFIFCPPENKDLTDFGEACELEDNSPHMPDYQSPIIYLFSYKQGEYNGDINGEGVRLSPDGKYVYELSLDGDIDGDTYKRMLSSFKFTNGSEIAK